jgi:hypothetical protein
MHTLLCGKTHFAYNPNDLSGYVQVWDDNSEGYTPIPRDDLLEFVAEYVRTQRITQLTQMSTKELLGLPD